jgi:hypothetical protein
MSSFLGAMNRVMHLGQRLIAFARRTADESMSSCCKLNKRQESFPVFFMFSLRGRSTRNMRCLRTVF